MADKSTYFAGEVLKLATGQALAMTPPITPRVALFTVMPTKAGTGGTEVSGGGYARVSAAGKFGAPVAGGSSDSFASTCSNSSIIDFGTASAAWGSVVGFALMDASSGGNIIAFGTLASAKGVNSSDPVSFPVGALTLQEV